MMFGRLRAFDARRWLTIGLGALISWTSTLIPFLIPGVILALRRTRPEGPVIWMLAGAGFALTTAGIWQGTPGGALLGIPMFMIGGALADRIWQVVSLPTRTGVLALTTLAGLAMPALTGIVDLVLRARIP